MFHLTEELTVASDVEGNRELISDNQTGLLVALNDKKAFTKALMRYVLNSNLRKGDGAAAR